MRFPWRIWFYDLSHVKVGKKTPLTLAHFGFDASGGLVAETLLPATLTAEWAANVQRRAEAFPSYARLLAHRGTSKADSPHSWTVDFADRRAKAREDMLPLAAKVASLKDEAVELRVAIRNLKREKGSAAKLKLLEQQVKERERSARELEAEAATIDAAVFDLRAVNPNAVDKVDKRTLAEIVDAIDSDGQMVAAALARLSTLLASGETATRVVQHPAVSRTEAKSTPKGKKAVARS